MRPLIIQVPQGKGAEVLQKAEEQKAKNVSLWQATGQDQPLDVVLAFVSNRKVEKLIAALDKLEDVRITLFPQGVMAMYPPQNQTPQQVTNVELRSPIEIFLAGLQSIGSWKGFISYAVISSIVVWIGLFTNTAFLLVGAMMIAPFAGPAMTTAIATAKGDWTLMKRSLIRYGVAIAVTVVSTFLLSLLLHQTTTTSMMVDRSQVSSVALLLAISAGAAGAINLVQSERSSLVSGAATGMLVAASLAPPTGVIGMAIALGEWNMTMSGVFLLILQLAGINLSGSLIFLLFGLRFRGPRYHTGRKTVVIISLVVTLFMLSFLAFWQFHQEPNLQRASLSKRAEAEIQQVVKRHADVGLIEATTRFTAANIQGQNTLLCVVYVQKLAGNHHTEEAIKSNLKQEIAAAIQKRVEQVTPVVDVLVLEPSSSP